MRNFKISIDLSDVYLELQHLNLDQYTVPFMTVFVEADNPDEACRVITKRILKEIMKNGSSIENRVLCQKIKKLIRIDKIESL